MTAKQNYDPTISIMKGIAIISVVLGHSNVGSMTEMVVNQYHLAVFFFVAGFCFKDKYLSNFPSYAWRRFKSLYVPFMEFGLLFIVLHNLFYYIHVEGNLYSLGDIIHEIRNITIGMTSEDPLMGAMWFCPALFSVSLISFLCLRLGTFVADKVNKRYSLLFIFLTFVFVISCGRILTDLHIKSPRCMWEYIQITGIFFIGYFLKRLINEGKYTYLYKYIKHFVPLFVLIVVGLLIFGYRANLQSYVIDDENLIILYLIAGLSSLVIREISISIAKFRFSRMFSYIGDHSFSIMALHFLSFKSITYFVCLYEGGNFELLQSFPTIHPTPLALVAIYTIAGVCLPLVLSKLYFISKSYLTNFISNGRNRNS